MTDAPPSNEPVTYIVNPTRLQHGQWCFKSHKTVGEGDIVASYSGDRIAANEPIRKPFTWQASLWVCVGMEHRDITTAQAYRLTQPEVFNRNPVSYAEKTGNDNAEAARHDPNGFYDRIIVKHGGKRSVLCGPPALFIPGPEQPKQPKQLEQMDLFGSEPAFEGNPAPEAKRPTHSGQVNLFNDRAP